MAKKTKGKHTQPKAAVIFKKKKKNKAQDSEEISEPSISQNIGAHSQTAVAAAAAAAAGPAQDAFKPATEVIEKKKLSKKKIAQRIAIISLSIIGFLALVYLLGVWFFSTHFYPNTYISTKDISWSAPVDVQKDFNTKVGDYSLKVRGNGMNLNISSKDAGINIDSVTMTEKIQRGQNPWKWPIEVFQSRDVTKALTETMSATKLSEIVKNEVDKINADGHDAINARVEFVKKSNKFEIIPEEQGTKLDFDAVLAKILFGAMNLEDKVVIMNDCLVPPPVLKGDPKIIAACTQANSMIKNEFQIVMGETPAYLVSAEVMSPWIYITPEYAAMLNEGSLKIWADELSQALNTVGSERSYTRPDGAVFTVSGGDYGWEIDVETLANQLVEKIKAGTPGDVAAPVLQSATGFNGIGARDWGNRYIDVDLGAQHAILYNEDNTILWEADIVSGEYKRRDTPCGVYSVNNVGRHVTLVGRRADGSEEYRTPVDFWMPFIKNSIGFHDATWQSSFGGSRYRNGYGSHGCINLSYSKAEELFGKINVGDVVVVHY